MTRKNPSLQYLKTRDEFSEFSHIQFAKKGGVLKLRLIISYPTTGSSGGGGTSPPRIRRRGPWIGGSWCRHWPELALVPVPQPAVCRLSNSVRNWIKWQALHRHLAQAQTPNQVPNLFQAVFQQSLHQDQ